MATTRLHPNQDDVLDTFSLDWVPGRFAVKGRDYDEYIGVSTRGPGQPVEEPVTVTMAVQISRICTVADLSHIDCSAVQNGGYRVHTIAELLLPVNEAPVPGPASQVSGGPVRLLPPGPRRRHDEVIGDLPAEALLALVWGW
jgi:hypothetical protein